MKFKALQENLRKTLWGRIQKGGLTGLGLAHQTGFQQAHISNFLNRKRGLSVEGMDKVLSVQHLSVLDLLDPAEVNKRASILPPSAGEFEDILLVDGTVAATAAIVMSMKVKEIVKFKKSFLRHLRPAKEGARAGWERFVAIKIDAIDGLSMYPRLLPAALLSLIATTTRSSPIAKANPTYMPSPGDNGKDHACTVKYVEVMGRKPSCCVPTTTPIGRNCADGRRQERLRLPGRKGLSRWDRNLGVQVPDSPSQKVHDTGLSPIGSSTFTAKCKGSFEGGNFPPSNRNCLRRPHIAVNHSTGIRVTADDGTAVIDTSNPCFSGSGNVTAV